MGEAALCTLKDCVQSFSDGGPLPAVPGEIYTVEELVAHLRAAAAGLPRRYNMELEGGVRVAIWLGGPWAAIQWCQLYFGQPPRPDRAPAWRARAEHPPDVEYVPFLLSTREDDIRADWLLPADEVMRMAAHIAEHRALPPWGVWVDNEGNRYAGGRWAAEAVRGDGVIPF